MADLVLFAVPYFLVLLILACAAARTLQSVEGADRANTSTSRRTAHKWNNSGEIAAWIALPLRGVPPWLTFASFALKQVHQVWVHTEKIEKCWRPVEFIFSTPSHHRANLDRNCRGIRIVRGRWFGTLDPGLSRPHDGLTKPVDTFNIWALQTHEYGAIVRDIRRATRWKTGSVTCSDRPAGPRRGCHEEFACRFELRRA
jgi:hypothetical protein